MKECVEFPGHLKISFNFFFKGLDCNENSFVYLDQRGARKQSFVHAKHGLTSCKV